MMKPLSLYLHIPFCVQKCHYCDFLSAPTSEAEKKAYLKALLTEIEQESTAYRHYQGQTVFIGGGTPSLLAAAEIEEILCKLKQSFGFAPPEETEITIEVNPGSAAYEKLCRYRQAGINRLSIGLQSANEQELKRLGRVHTWADFLRTFEDAREAGFTNINVDLIAALPGQSKHSYQASLRKVVALNPEHISAYSLIVEPGTPFYECYAPGGEKASLLPTEEQERQMYYQATAFLAEKNYARYEISNYARPGFSCRHNMVYWRRGDYVGFGLGAASLIANTRWSNTANLEGYISAFHSTNHFSQAGSRPNAIRLNQIGPRNYHPTSVDTDSKVTVKENLQTLTVKEQMEEFMFLGLRLTDGVNPTEFYQYFQQDIKDIYGNILTKLEADRLITSNGTIRLTPYGIDISNYVMAQFLFSD